MPTANFDTSSSISCISDDESSCTITENRNGAGTMVSRSFWDLVFTQVPSRLEAEKSVSALQSLVRDLFSPGSATSNWFNQMFGNNESSIWQSKGFRTFLSVIQMLQREPAFQNMLISLACDKAVWDAVRKNKAVREIQELIRELLSSGTLKGATKENPRIFTYDDEGDLSERIIRWIINITKEKVMELIECFKMIVAGMFPSPGQGKAFAKVDQFDEKVGPVVFLLSVIYFIMVVFRAMMI